MNTVVLRPSGIYLFVGLCWCRCVFIEHITTHNPHRTPDSCWLSEHRSRWDALIHTTIFSAVYSIYQQNNALFHSGRILIECIEQHSFKFQMVYRPTNSTNMKSVEHLWFNFEIKIRAATLARHNVLEYQDQFHNAWYQIPQIACENFKELILSGIFGVYEGERWSYVQFVVIEWLFGVSFIIYWKKHYSILQWIISVTIIIYRF